MSFPNDKCEKCGKEYTYEYLRWCKPCQINNFKKILTNWTIEKEIDNLVEEMHSKIENYYDIVFEWIPYNQFYNIEEISRGDLATIYSAIWNDGPLYYNHNEYKYTRKPNRKVVLRCIHNSQNITSKFLNEV